MAKNPGLNISTSNGALTNNFIRISETGIGLGWEAGIGFRKDLDRRFSLMPLFTFSGGVVNISDVATITDNVIAFQNYRAKILSFNLGLSIAYRFY